MTTQQRIGTGFAIVAALGFAVWIWASPVLNMGISSTEAPLASSGGLVYGVTPSGDRYHAQSTEFYDISVSYPNKTPLVLSAGSTANEAALAMMESWLSQQVTGFIAMGDFGSMTEEDKEIIGFNDGRKYTLDITYKEFQSPQIVSYVFTVYTDTLGAHPNAYFYTFMFDARTGQGLTVGDLFASSEWLERISAESRKQIVAHMQDMAGAGGEVALFEEGLAPEEGNFLSAYVDGEDIVILFDPYQVAPYAAGPQEVRIERSKVADILKPEYR